MKSEELVGKVAVVFGPGKTIIATVGNGKVAFADTATTLTYETPEGFTLKDGIYDALVAEDGKAIAYTHRAVLAGSSAPVEKKVAKKAENKPSVSQSSNTGYGGKSQKR